MTVERGLGWIPDAPDARDYRLGQVGALPADLTRTTYALELRDLYGDVCGIRDQGGTSACTGYAVTPGVELRRALDGQERVKLAPLAAYWGGRALYGFAGADEGAYVRGCIKWAMRVGLPFEDAWPMDSDTYEGRPGSKINQRPAAAAEVRSLDATRAAYERIPMGAGVVDRVLDCLQLRIPVVGGFQITTAFRRAKAGETIPAPTAGERREGGHAILLIGFDRSGERALFANSWGPGYGDQGYGWLAAGWLQDAGTGDLWALRARP